MSDATKSGDFSPGDIVKLKSGGPPMIVVGCWPGGACCQWFDPIGEPIEQESDVTRGEPAAVDVAEQHLCNGPLRESVFYPFTLKLIREV